MSDIQSSPAAARPCRAPGGVCVYIHGRCNTNRYGCHSDPYVPPAARPAGPGPTTGAGERATVEGEETREDVDLMALDLLDRGGGDCVGVIDDEHKLAAALLYIDLEQRGLAHSEPGEKGPFYTITSHGRAWRAQRRERSPLR